MTTFTVGDQITLEDGRQMTVIDTKENSAGEVTNVLTTYENHNGNNQTNWHKVDKLAKRITQHTPAPTADETESDDYHISRSDGDDQSFTVVNDLAKDITQDMTNYFLSRVDGPTDPKLLADAPIPDALQARADEEGWSEQTLRTYADALYVLPADLEQQALDEAWDSRLVALTADAYIGSEEFTPPTDPTPTPHPDAPADLFSLPKQAGSLSDVITAKPAPPPRRKMSPDEERNALYYLTGCTSMNHNHARSLVEYFGHEVGNALTAGEGLDAAPGIGHVTGPTAASAWNRAPAWVRECLPLAIEGYPPRYIEYVMVHNLATDPDHVRDKFPLPNNEQPYAHLVALAGPDLQQLAAYIHAIATFIENEGNKGYERYELEVRMDKLGHDDSGMYLLHRVYEDLWRGILFYADGGGHSDYSGWGVRKNPHWRGVWMDRFKHHAPTLYQDELDTLHDQALKETAVPPRPHGDSLLGFSTLTLAYHAACADVLVQRYTVCTTFRRQSDDSYKIAVHRARLRLITDELAYRARYIPAAGHDHYDPRLSLADAIEDYEQAAPYIRESWTPDHAVYKGRDHFFTPEYVEQVVCAASEPDLHIDLNDPSSYPRGTLAQTPPQQLTIKQVLVTITELLLTQTEDEFTEDDKDNFLALAANVLPDAHAYESDAWQRLRARLDRLNLVNRS